MEFKYERKEQEYSQGDILRNLNGTDYRVLERLSERNLLLLNLQTGQFTVGLGVGTYVKSPKLEVTTKENVTEGIEWEHGVYLGYTPSQIDFEKIRYEYGSSKEYTNGEPGEVSEYNIEITEVLSKTITVQAKDLSEAMELVRDKYYGEEVILDAEDLKDVNFKPCEFVREQQKEKSR